jgi:hypothetical protein
MSADITISDNQGNVLAELTDLPMINIVSHHQNKDSTMLMKHQSGLDFLYHFFGS